MKAIKVRLTEEGRCGAQAAATARGLPLATWMRDVVLHAIMASPEGYRAFAAERAATKARSKSSSGGPTRPESDPPARG